MIIIESTYLINKRIFNMLMEIFSGHDIYLFRHPTLYNKHLILTIHSYREFPLVKMPDADAF